TGATAPPAANVGGTTFVSLGVFAVTAQLSLCYFFNAIHKQGTSWRDGSAVNYAIHLDRLATWFAVALRDWMSPTFARGLTYSALATEAALPVLLLSPLFV